MNHNFLLHLGTSDITFKYPSSQHRGPVRDFWPSVTHNRYLPFTLLISVHCPSNGGYKNVAAANKKHTNMYVKHLTVQQISFCPPPVQGHLWLDAF